MLSELIKVAVAGAKVEAAASAIPKPEPITLTVDDFALEGTHLAPDTTSVVVRQAAKIHELRFAEAQYKRGFMEQAQMVMRLSRALGFIREYTIEQLEAEIARLKRVETTAKKRTLVRRIASIIEKLRQPRVEHVGGPYYQESSDE